MIFFSNKYNLILVGAVLISALMLFLPILSKKDFILTVDEAIIFINRKAGLMLDVRAGKLLAKEGHIPQAKHCPLADLPTKSKELIKNKAHPTLIIADSAKEARLARKTLIDQGYSEVFVVSGGLSAWRAAGLLIK